ncbi:MAG: NAD(P)-dependent oxidoreductase, partial [Thermodesulfobacteriota bacterium]
GRPGHCAMMRVLVTGASGFVGRHTVGPLLARGFTVHAVTGSGRILPEPGVIWHRADLLAPAAVRALVETVRPSHLLHLAWYAKPGRYLTAPENLSWVAASLGLFQAFAARGGGRMVVAGTCLEYARSDQPCVEGHTPCQPESVYAVAKHALGLLAAAFCRQAGVSLGWARLFHLFGPFEPENRLVSTVARALVHGQAAACTLGEQVRDFSHIADAGAALAALLDSRVEGPVNIASGRPTRVADLVLTLADLGGRRDLILLGARPTPADESPFLVADVGRLTREVGWTPARSLEQTLEETLAWWRQLR